MMVLLINIFGKNELRVPATMSGGTDSIQFDISNFTVEDQSLKKKLSEHHTLFDAKILAKTISVSLEEINLDKEQQPRRGAQYLVAVIVTVSGFIIGTTLGWTSPAGPMMKNKQYNFPVTEENISWIAALMPLGAMIGCPVMAAVVDNLGRKRTMAFLTIPTIIGWVTIIWASSVTWIYVGRALTGFASGSYSVIVPLYTSEIADMEIRGTLGTYFQLQMFLGILYTYVFGSYVNVFSLSTACALVPTVFACLLVLVPESPIYYLMRADVENARSSLRYFRQSLGNVEEELEAMQVSLVRAERDRLTLTKAFQTAQAKRGLSIGLGLMVFQQFTGCNAVIFYATTIFNVRTRAVAYLGILGQGQHIFPPTPSQKKMSLLIIIIY
ncbi:facilitated trehalose transporter Tret1-like isoform X1 [Sipha flava]|uniref:Facilitated trehalose transporter Tret1-like isoform X1 n=1 Tax=Sipha flava TaxID=143950 RepID=A0A8B8G4A3_9HEMI|nr:facilitated trehalose transporter Tret1-like isoform X1 [Sipha flava]